MSEPADMLAIELSTESGSVAVTRDGALVYENRFVSQRSHNAKVFGVLQEALGEVQTLGGIVIGRGPGSYTGVRIAIAAGIGIALARQCTLSGVSSLLAFEGLEDYDVIGDARRGRYYLARVRNARLEGAIEIMPPAECLRQARAEILVTTESRLAEQHPQLVFTVPSAIALAHYATAHPKAELLADNAALEPWYLEEAFVTLPRDKKI